MNFELGHGKVHGLSHQRNQIIKWLEIADFEPNFFFLWSIHVWYCKILPFISNSFSAIFLISNVYTKKDFCFKCHYEAFYVCTL